MKYKRVLLKLSGESIGGRIGVGLDENILAQYAREIHDTVALGVEIAIVIGGGNIFRGLSGVGKGFDRVKRDQMGMLATIINGMALQEALERLGAPTRMLTAFEVKSVAEPYIRRRAIRHLEKGRIVILTAGTGHPFFTTDSGAALRAVELHCNVILKASLVNGIYSEDPKKNIKAKFYKKLNYQDALENHIEIMDATAFAICQKHKMPIIVFNINNLHNLEKILEGEDIGTLVS